MEHTLQIKEFNLNQKLNNILWLEIAQNMKIVQ